MKKINFLLILVFLCSCKHKVRSVIFDNTTPNKPVLKIILPSGQASYQSDKVYGALFMIENGKTVTMPVALNSYLSKDTLLLVPYSSLGSGIEFEWQIYDKKDTLRKRFFTQAVQSAAPKVVSVFPLSDTIPSNILVFHFLFSSKMNCDPQAYKYINITDDRNKTIPHVWREKASWDSSGKHLTLMIHPGRIKRGINYGDERSKLFEHGRKYKISINGLQAENSSKTIIPFHKNLFVSAPDRSLPSFESGKFTPPQINTFNPVTLVFNKPMDWGSVTIGLAIKKQSGETVKGTLSPVNDKTYLFTPEKKWSNAGYSVSYNEYLTDLCGNHINRAFEVKNINAIKASSDVLLKFTPKN